MFTAIAFIGIVFLTVFRQFWKYTPLHAAKFNNIVNLCCTLGILLAAGYLFYPHFKNLTKPTPDAWAKRETMVSQKDLLILKRAASFLKTKETWDQNHDRYCLIWVKKSLFCAIALAQKEVDGQYIHGSTSIQHVRFVIDDRYKSRWKVHPIMDFNNHPDTTFEDVKKLLDAAIVSIEAKLE